MAGLRAVFKKDGTVTAGNASGINDGASMVVLASGQEVERQELKPMARLFLMAAAEYPMKLWGLGQ